MKNANHLALGLLCVVLGTVIAYRGITTITWTTRILVPVLLLVGIVVVIVGFSAVPVDVIWNYKPVDTGYDNNIIPYILSIEANFAFVITLVGGMAEVPRLCKKEKAGYYAGVLGQGLAGSFFVVVGAVMAIAMQYVTGEMIDDPTLMMATLSVPALALTSLLLVAFANVGTQAVGSYLYGVMLKSTFKKADYRLLVLVLGAYVAVLCVWGKIIEYFGSFLTITACIYAPLAALLFTDFFDEYAWQREQQMKITYPDRAKGLHLPLYQCRCCKSEFRMQSEGARLYCEKCGASYEMDEYGTLKNQQEECYIPDWYEWQREQVKKEIDAQQYRLDCKVHIQALPNAKNFIDCGEGHLVHNENGFQLSFHDYITDDEQVLQWKSASCYSVHTEYDYRGQGQCITLSTLDNSYFLFPLEEGFNATKIQFATEYLYEKGMHKTK